MKVAVFGTGGYFQKKRSSIKGEIIFYVDNLKKGKFEGIPIISPFKLKELEFDKIYVMSSSYISIAYQLLHIGIEKSKIVFGANLEPYNDFEKNMIGTNKKIIINEDDKICYSYEDIQIAVNTFDELYNVRDIFWEKAYQFFSVGKRKIVVIDIGMNIGAATVYFASRSDIDKVYGYEPFKATYEMALYNISRNDKLKAKSILINAGIGIEDKTQLSDFNPQMTCGLSTVKDAGIHAYKMYNSWGWVKEEQTIEEEIKIIDILPECQTIFKDNPEHNFILKIDCEGAEYDILEKLHNYGILKKFSIIMLEWHYRKAQRIENILQEDSFSYFSFVKSNTMGTIYAVNKEIQ